MKPLVTAVSLTLALAACGSPQDEDKLTPESIEDSQSAAEKPDIALSNNPEPEPAPAKPAASEPSVKTDTAVAHAAPSAAKKRPSAKPTAKRRPARTVQPPRAVPVSPPPQPEDDLDALLPH